MRDARARIPLLLAIYGVYLVRAAARAQQALALAQRGYRQLFDNAVNGMAVVDHAGQVVAANNSYARMLGYDKDELLNVDFFALKRPAERRAARAALQAVRAGQVARSSTERRYLHRDGALVWARSSLSILEQDAGPHAHAARRQPHWIRLCSSA